MSQEEQDQIEAKALHRRHKAAKQVNAYKSKLDSRVQQLRRLVQAWESATISVSNAEGRTRLCMIQVGTIDYPSEEDLIANVTVYEEAKAEKLAADIECGNLCLID